MRLPGVVTPAGVGGPAVPTVEDRHPTEGPTMWKLLKLRLRTLVVLAVLVPLVGWLARRLAERSEARHDGATTTSRVLRGVDATTRKARALA
ncbi:hypothetical protein CLV34_2516 [Luteimicrobium subarcticum]|uniref:Uncharacterized protein n=1 Tax=Luteimicrobium subarcticum TaxID=620910 RepID=A0A2M8W6N8_9MICO|nr:hypothetical protein CLV34_2516 [Luteimicrobium subarcticum]